MPCRKAHKPSPHGRAVPSTRHSPPPVPPHGDLSAPFHPAALKIPSQTRRSANADPLPPLPAAPFLCHRPAVCLLRPPRAESASRFLCPETPPPRAANTRSARSCVQLFPLSSLHSPATSAAFASPPTAASATAHPVPPPSPSSCANLPIAPAAYRASQSRISLSHPANSAPAPCAAKVDRASPVRYSAAQSPPAVAAFPSGSVRSRSR